MKHRSVRTTNPFVVACFLGVNAASLRTRDTARDLLCPRYVARGAFHSRPRALNRRIPIMKKLAAVTFVRIGVYLSAHVVLSANSVPQVQSSSYCGNYASDESTDAVVDGRGFVYVVGVSELFGGNADAFVLKLTPDGSELRSPRISVAAASTSRTRWPSTPRARSTWPGTRHQPTFLSFSRFSRVSAARRTRGSRSSILPYPAQVPWCS